MGLWGSRHRANAESRLLSRPDCIAPRNPPDPCRFAGDKSVTHHWSVHGAAARALDELAPGRFVLGLSAGDGAVHSVGLRPARWRDVERAVVSLRPLAPPDLKIHIATSGANGAEAAGRVASVLELGVGVDVETLEFLASRGRAARSLAGINAPLGIWAMVPVYVAEREADVEEARLALRAIANGSARFCFSGGFADKNIPQAWQPIIRERLNRYDHNYHAVVGRDAPNSLLFSDRNDVQGYLLDRMIVVGTEDQVQERLALTAQRAGLDGIWISLVSSPFGEQRDVLVQRLGGALAPMLGERRRP